MYEVISNGRLRVILPVAVSAICIVEVGSLLAFYFSHLNIPMPLSKDSVYEFRDWMGGAETWERIRHNGVASWGSSLGLYLDAEIGPHPLWSYAIGYSLLVIFIGFFASVSKPTLGTPLTILFLSVFVLYWFLRFNLAQSITYVWRLPEVGQQLAALGSSIFLLRFRNQLGSPAVFGLIFLTFCLSQTHAGYVIFCALIIFLVYLEERWRTRAIYLGVFVAYVAYMFTIDGTFTHLLREVASSPEDDGASLIELVIAIFGLQSQAPGRIFSLVGWEAVSPVIRILFVGSVLLLAVHAVRRLLTSRDEEAIVYLFLVLSQLGIVALIVVGRFSDYGMDVMDVPRYSSYSLVTLFASAWYVAVISSKRLALVLLVAMAVIGFEVVPVTRQYLSASVKWYGYRAAMIYSVALAGKVEPFHEMTQLEQTAFLSYVIPGLKERRSAGFGPGAWSAVQDLEPITQPVPRCAGKLRLQSQRPDSAYVVWDYQYSGDPQEEPDFGFAVSSTDDVVGLSPNISVANRRSMRFYVPVSSAGVTFYTARFGPEERAPPEILCQIEPSVPSPDR